MTRTDRRDRRDEGFTLIETVVAVMLMAIILAGVAGLLIRSTSSAAHLARTNVAAQLSDQQMELVRAVRPTETDPGASKLLDGRSQSAVEGQWADGPAELAGTDPAWDTSPSGTPAVPLRSEQTVDDQPYVLETYIGTCTQAQNPTTGVPVGPCATTVADGVLTYRVLVRVSWERGGTETCGGGDCEFLLTTLVNADGDFIFNTGADVEGPSGAADDVSVAFNTVSASFNVLTNDSPGDNGFATNPVGVTQQPANGVLSASQATGTMTYTPNANYHGVDGFVYKLTDSSGLVSEEVFVTVTVNRPPVPTAANLALTGTRGVARPVTVLSPVNAKWHGTNAVSIVTAPASGAAISISGGVISYTAPALFAGTETFRYRITDLSGQTAEAVVTVTVAPPTAANDAYGASRTGPVDFNVRSNDSPEFAAATVTIVTAPSRGTAQVVNGQVRYTATPMTPGTSDSLVYRVTNGPLTATATVTITIPPLPTAVDDTAQAVRGSAVDINVRGNDNTAFASGTVTVTNGPSHGTVAVVNGQVRYTVDPSTTATSDSLVYEVVSGGLSSSANVTITIPAPPAPTAASGTACFPNQRNRNVSIDLLALVTGPGVDGSSITIRTAPNNRYTLRSGPEPDGVVVYRTSNNQNPNNSSFTYRVTDSLGRTADGTIQLRPGTSC
ncbi:Ig-like domain-containing protein [Jannaschia sp. R86511]|uniref:Ig-like domain-containing protein n=1 Tax=Jannaschia sp. R86511 TaxID=3093853 RepID=UPI0036D3BFA4